MDAILRGAGDLPDDLAELKQAIKDQQSDVQEEVMSVPEVRNERRNIWAEEGLDISRLRLGKDESYVDPKVYWILG